MMDLESLRQVIEQYRMHGWDLQSILFSEPLSPKLDQIKAIVGKVELIRSELDAAWFSRLSRPGMTAWELRHLSSVPYALIAGIDDELTPEEAESARRATEMKMLKVVRDRKFGD
ncbi:MAG TPA: hypothetical protein PKD26_00465 [Pyrinomonadaceae bacterium]|nr:hypothetical protein [Pyrinomonadaceae bacterium]